MKKVVAICCSLLFAGCETNFQSEARFDHWYGNLYQKCLDNGGKFYFDKDPPTVSCLTLLQNGEQSVFFWERYFAEPGVKE